MEENKYYTPILEEFSVGFEYEFILRNGQYKKRICEAIDIYEVEAAMKYSDVDFSNKCRVKYLDKEDIESLGWRFEKQHPGLEELQFTMDLGGYDDMCLDYDLDSKYLRISWYGEGDVTRFSGVVNNKSELIKLMKQLNIKWEK